MNTILISPEMGEIRIKEKKDFSQKKLRNLEKQLGAVNYIVIRDNLSSKKYKEHNFHNFITGRQFFHTQHGYKAYPPGVYFSEDLEFMKSMVNIYKEKHNKLYKKLKNIGTGGYLKFLYELYDKYEGNTIRKNFMKEYLTAFEDKYKKESYHLFSIAEGNNFIYWGFYLFEILPEYFIKIMK
jgi:hypothetical protein